jgi:hypothetical protein
VERRIAWDALPGPLKQAIEARTGPITRVRVASAGQNSPLAVIIDARGGKVFASARVVMAWIRAEGSRTSCRSRPCPAECR